MKTAERTHDLKVWPYFFAALLDGSKQCEARLNDRDYRVRDILRIREWDPADCEYTGRELTRRVTYLLAGPAFGVKAGHVVMCLERPPSEQAVLDAALAWRQASLYYGSDAIELRAAVDVLLAERAAQTPASELTAERTAQLVAALASPARDLPKLRAALAQPIPVVLCGCNELHWCSAHNTHAKRSKNASKPEAAPTVEWTPTEGVVSEIGAERKRQHAQWGPQDHADGTNDGPAVVRSLASALDRPGYNETISAPRALAKEAKWLCRNANPSTFTRILLEEVFEALAETNFADLRAALVQVAAVACQWIETIDRRSTAPTRDAAKEAALAVARGNK